MTFFARKIFTLFTLVCLLGQDVTADVANLPDLGDESGTLFSPSQERKLGADFMRAARRQLNIVDDPELNAYLQSIGHRLLPKNGPTAYQELHFFIIKDPSINAFAVPGGYIGVHTGLILATENEAEVASVLAHETAHLTQRHLLRMNAQSKRTSVPAMAALLAAILLAGSGRQGGEAAIAMTTAALAQKEINFTREFEQEADRIGMGLLTQAGYDARGMPAFFERMQSQTRLYESNLPEFLRTHPITTRRIAESRDQAERYPVVKNPDSTDFYHAQAKIRALSDDSSADTLLRFKNNLDSGRYPSKNAELYGYALALLNNKQYPEARATLQTLLTQHPEYGLYRIAQAEIELAAGNGAEALKLYAAAVRKYPKDYALSQHYAAALLKTGHAREARNLLKAVVRLWPEEPALQKMFAIAAGDSGSLLEAHQAMAEYYYLSGNSDAAIAQLQIARRQAGENFYFLSSIDARIKDIREEAALYKNNAN
jgi:beta-barrel assembly-enhancing protease